MGGFGHSFHVVRHVVGHSDHVCQSWLQTADTKALVVTRPALSGLRVKESAGVTFWSYLQVLHTLPVCSPPHSRRLVIPTGHQVLPICRKGHAPDRRFMTAVVSNETS